MALKTKTAMAVISIGEVELDPQAHAAKFLNDSEYQDICNRSSKTLAGRIAAKKAVVGLLMSLGFDVLQPQEILIETLEDGAPVVVVAGDFDPGRLFISISHSTKTAVAVAAAQIEDF